MCYRLWGWLGPWPWLWLLCWCLAPVSVWTASMRVDPPGGSECLVRVWCILVSAVERVLASGSLLACQVGCLVVLLWGTPGKKYKE